MNEAGIGSKRSLLIRGGMFLLPPPMEPFRGDLLIAEGRIARLGRGLTAEEVLDARGLYVAPGFIDLQVNGGAGHDFMEADAKAINEIIDFHVAHGTTGLLATLISAPIAQLREAMGQIRKAEHPALLGVHLEGPFISPAQRGAHAPGHILAPSRERFDELVRGYEDLVRIVTFAPELPGADALLARIVELRMIPALGHSNATYEEACAAVAHGVRFFTHLFNGMRGFHHREPGAVGAGLLTEVMVGLIADKVHVHPAAMRLVYRLKGPERICLVTDAIGAAGLPDGGYRLGRQRVSVQEGIARLADGSGVLAGSTLTMDRAVRNFLEATGCSLSEAVQAVSLNPARLLGLAECKGSLVEGKDADLVLFDADFNVHYTIIGGEVVYAR